MSRGLCAMRTGVLPNYGFIQLSTSHSRVPIGCPVNARHESKKWLIIAFVDRQVYEERRSDQIVESKHSANVRRSRCWSNTRVVRIRENDDGRIRPRNELPTVRDARGNRSREHDDGTCDRLSSRNRQHLSVYIFFYISVFPLRPRVRHITDCKGTFRIWIWY
jgi:hypothetical protein